MRIASPADQRSPQGMLSNKKPLRGYFYNLYSPPSGKPESACINYKKAVLTAFLFEREKDCFACRSAIPEMKLSNKKPLRGYFYNLYSPPSDKPESACINYKKAVFTAFLFEREKGFEPSTLSLEGIK
jgi:ABC-type cobalt transport system substrate-binding protein